MADNLKVNIDITAKGDAAPIQQVERALADAGTQAKAADASFKETEKALEGVEAQAKKTGAALTQGSGGGNPWITASRNADAHADSVGKRVVDAQDKATRGQVNLSNALLQGSRAFQDAQYGVAGLLNNVEALAMAFGLGSGVAGVATVAAVALSQLWPMFSGADDAKEKTEAATQRLKEMTEALEGASKASEEAFKADLEKYANEVERGTRAWGDQARNIQEALNFANQLAAVQMATANHKLEIQRQDALATAATPEARAAINADFDHRKAQMNDQGRVEAARRSLVAQEAEDAMLKRQYGAVDWQRGEAQGRLFQNQARTRQFVENFGPQSDQGRDVRAYEQSRADLARMQQQLQSFEQLGITPESSGAYEALREQISEVQDKLATQQVAVRSQREKLEKGDLSFNRLSEEAEKEKDAEKIQVREEALFQLDQINLEKKTVGEQLLKFDQSLKDIRTAQVASGQQVVLRRAQVEEADLAATETQRKQKTDQVRADEAAAQKAREQQALRLENDARQAEQEGKLAAAARLRGKAAQTLLTPSATDEDKRRVELDYTAGVMQAEEAMARQENKLQGNAAGLGRKVAAWANAAPDVKEPERGGRSRESLNEAAIEAAAKKLEDGGDVSELQKLREVIERFAGGIVGSSEARREEIRQLYGRVRELEQQTKNSSTRSP